VVSRRPASSTRAERIAFVERMRREIEKDEPPKPSTPASRKRTIEVLALEAGLPLPKWDRVPRGRPELIDERPWAAGRAASARMQYERLGKFGLAFARDGSIRCVKCKEVVLALPRTGALAIGTTGSALAARHAQATGCR
jgi:hypothetical protein